ncbi:MAG: SLBB domain-containing protein [Phycisphaerae bacterium]
MKTTQLLVTLLMLASAWTMGCDEAKINHYRFLNAGDVIVRPDGTNPVLPILNSMNPLDQHEQIVPHATFPAPADLTYEDTDYRIGPGDVMNVLILELYFEGGETVVQKTVSESGYIDLPLLDKQIKAAELTKQQLRETIVDAYDAKGILRKDRASVQIELLVRRKAVFSILGSVVRPGAYPVTRPDMRLLEALAIGGGVAQNNIKYIYVIRHGGTKPLNGMGPVAPTNNGQGNKQQQDQPGSGFEELRDSLQTPSVLRLSAAGGDPTAENDPSELQNGGWNPDISGWTRANGDDQGQDESPQPETAAGNGDDDDDPFGFPDSMTAAGRSRVIAINLDKLRRGDPMMNIVIRDSDVIQVIPLEVGVFYVAGHVARPGVYDLTGRDVTVKQAITAAGMFDPVAWPENSVLIRRIGDSEETFIPLDLEAIWAGTDPDVFVRSDDVIAVGTNWRATFLAVFRNAFRMTYGFGFIYDRNFAEPLDFGGALHDSSRFKRW